jgi:hypothetical protein
MYLTRDIPKKILSGTCPTVKTHSVLTDTLSQRDSEITMENPFESADTTRRDVLRKAVFIAPVILTLPVLPSFAKAGSSGGDDRDDTDTSGGSPSQRRRRHHHNGWWFFS